MIAILDLMGSIGDAGAEIQHASLEELNYIEDVALHNIQRYEGLLTKYKADLDRLHPEQVIEMLTTIGVREEHAKAVVEGRARAYAEEYEYCMKVCPADKIREAIQAVVDEQRTWLGMLSIDLN